MSFNSIFNFFVTKAAKYECSYSRTAHHATAWSLLAGEVAIQKYRSLEV